MLLYKLLKQNLEEKEMPLVIKNAIETTEKERRPYNPTLDKIAEELYTWPYLDSLTIEAIFTALHEACFLESRDPGCLWGEIGGMDFKEFEPIFKRYHKKHCYK